MSKRDRIEAAEASVNFRAYALDQKKLTPELKIRLENKPKDGSACRIRGQMSGMWEPGIVCGYMLTSQGLKALVIYDELENEDGTPVIDFVFATRVTNPAAKKPERDVLSRRFR